jgi:aminomethyltransferase
MLKQTPLYQQHLILGAKMVEFAGWEMPVSYPAGIIAEHTAVRTNFGLFDIGHMGLIKIEGEDALALVQKTATNDASKLEINQCQYSILCNESGGVVDDILVYRLPMLFLIICNASNTDKVLAWLQKQAKSFKHASVGRYENYSMLSVQGPNAEKIVNPVLSVDVSALKHNHTLWWRDIIISRTGYTGEDGLELIVAKKEIEKIWAAFIKEGIQPCGLGARDTLRLEAGLPLYGHEYDDKTSPLEAGYDWAVKFDKGDFIGKKALLQQKEAGVARKLAGLEIEGRSIARSGDSIFDIRNSKLVGRVTSGTFSPTLKRPIALAYLATKEAAPGNTVRVEIRGKQTPAKVVAKTFYKR